MRSKTSAEKKIENALRRTHLTKLDLSGLDLNIMPMTLGLLTHLTELNLQDNKLTRIPKEIFRLKGLTHLNLNNNLLTKLPEEISQLKLLENLLLNDNKFIEFPNVILSLYNLDELCLGGNHLTYIPQGIDQLKCLTFLYLHNNCFAGFPLEVFKIQSIKLLSLLGNKLSQLPKEIVQLTQLVNLNLSDNQFATLPVEIGGLRYLKMLELNNNQFGELPNAIKHLHDLKSLSLNSNQLTSLPYWIGQLHNLEQIHLKGNNLNNISDWVSALPKKVIIDIENNPNIVIPPRILLDDDKYVLATRYLKEKHNRSEWINIAGMANMYLEKNSKAAVYETMLATIAALIIIIYIDNPLIWFTWAAIGWLYLLKTENSTKLGLTIFGGLMKLLHIKSGEQTTIFGVIQNSLGLGLLITALASIPIRIYATVVTMLRHPLKTITEIPNNLLNQTIKIDFSSPPELMPGSEKRYSEYPDTTISTIDYKYDWEAFDKLNFLDRLKLRFQERNHMVVLLVFFAITWLYRWSLKSTALIYSPLYFAHRLNSNENLRTTAKLYSRNLFHLGVIVLLCLAAFSTINWEYIGFGETAKVLSKQFTLASTFVHEFNIKILIGYSSRLGDDVFVFAFVMLAFNSLCTLFTAKYIDVFGIDSYIGNWWVIFKGMLFFQYVLSIIIMVYFYEWVARRMIAGWLLVA